MITEQQYNDALEIVKQYAQQINEETIKALELKKKVQEQVGIAELEKLKKDACNMNIVEIYQHPLFDKYRIVSVRLINGMRFGELEHKKICDITKNDILRARNLGKDAWRQLCDITGNRP